MHKNKKRFEILVVLLFLATLVFAPVSHALEIVVTGNGSESDNQVSTQIESQTIINQTNEATVENSINENANTGQNSTSENTGDTNITTGDIKSETTVTNNLNASYVETGCCSSSTSLTIFSNGSGSDNNVILAQKKNTDISISNIANITNSIKGDANTGINKANNNGGDVNINTGSINILNGIANESVNISYVKVSTGFPGLSAFIKDNGSGSDNLIKTHLSDDISVYLNNISNIDNYILWDANTGENEASGNTGGDVNITTGDIEVETFIKNFLNIGGVKIDCCKDIFDPGDGDDNGNGGDPGKDDDGKEDKKDNDVQGTILPSAAATEAGGPGIIGLSDTSSRGARALFFWLSLVFVAVGGKIITEELLPKTSIKKIR